MVLFPTRLPSLIHFVIQLTASRTQIRDAEVSR
jgi:hypothetical protein